MYLSSRVAIVIFVFISQSKLLGEFLLHLVVRHLFTQSLKRTHPKYSVSVREQHSHVLWWTIIVCGKEMLTASISLRAFHCSYGTPRCSAVWMALHSWLVQTLRSFICCSSTNRAKAAENYSREGSSCQHLKLIHYSVQILVILLPVEFYAAVCGCSYLSAPRREACVAAQPALHVVSALPVPTQVDGSGLDVDVHQVVDDLTLDVVLDAVDEVPPPHVYHLDKGEVPGGRVQTGGCEP